MRLEDQSVAAAARRIKEQEVRGGNREEGKGRKRKGKRGWGGNRGLKGLGERMSVASTRALTSLC